jgi:hypothetical protein
MMFGDGEAGVSARGHAVGDLDVIDAGAGRTMVKCVFEPLDRCQFPFDGSFDAAVVTIAYPAVHAFPRRRRLSEIAEADALDAAAD